jgi:uncharacterized membrane protein
MENEAPVQETGLTTEDKQWALLSYLVPPLSSLAILFIEDKAKRPFLKYHALLSLALGAVGTVLFCVYPLVWFYCIYLGIRAYQGQDVVVPFLSDWIEQQGWAKANTESS